MKLVLQADDVDLVASLIRNADGVDWFVQNMGLRLVESTDNLSAALRAAGAKRMRLDKSDEKMLGEFVRAETYSDGLFTHHFLYFEKALAHLASKDATASTMLTYLQFVGLPEGEFEKRPLFYLEVLGYAEDPEELTLESAGLDNSLKALYGRPLNVRRYRFGDQIVIVAKFKGKIHIDFGSEEQLLRIYHDLGIAYSCDRLARRVHALLGIRSGSLWAVLCNGQTVSLDVNQLSPGWAASLHQMCEQAGGGAVTIDL